MANEITFDKLPQAVGYLTEQVERIHNILLPLKNNTDTESSSIAQKMTEEKDLLLSEF